MAGKILTFVQHSKFFFFNFANKSQSTSQGMVLGAKSTLMRAPMCLWQPFEVFQVQNASYLTNLQIAISQQRITFMPRFLVCTPNFRCSWRNINEKKKFWFINFLWAISPCGRKQRAKSVLGPNARKIFFYMFRLHIP